MLWLTALALAERVPALVRFATLYRQRTHEGVAFVQVLGILLAVTLLLWLATTLSWRAHGKGGVAPRVVRLTRAATWTGLVLLATAAVIAPSLAGPDCFRTCLPFPQ